MAAQNTHFFAWSAYFRTRSPPKRDADSAKTRSETARFFVYIVLFRFHSAPKRTADRAYTARFFAHPCVDVLSLPPPVCCCVCVSPRGVCCLSPPEGVSCLRLKTKDERREDSAPPTLRRRLGKIHPPPIVRKLELSTFLPKDIRRPRFLPLHFSRFLHAF